MCPLLLCHLGANNVHVGHLFKENLLVGGRLDGTEVSVFLGEWRGGGIHVRMPLGVSRHKGAVCVHMKTIDINCSVS